MNLQNIKRSTPGHVIVARRFLGAGFGAAIGSLVAGIYVLYFTVYGQGTWDFQGASGVASVVPGMAGIILAGWAIYQQMRVAAPSYRAAEEALMEISDFRRSYAKIASVASASIPDPVGDYDQLDHDPEPDNEPGINIKDAVGRPPLTATQRMAEVHNHADRREANKKVKIDRAAKEFRIDITHSCDGSKGCSACESDTNSGRRSFASMAAKILPLLDTLQHHEDFTVDYSAFRVDITETEEIIDYLGYMYGDWDDGYDSHDWCGSVIDVIHSLDTLIRVLHSLGLLAPDVLERALLDPKQSLDIQSFKSKREEMRSHLKSNQIASNRAERFGSAGVMS